MAAWIENRRVKIRRATRRDVVAIGTMLGRSIPVRFGRRAVADRRDEVYVAQEVDGPLVGVVGLAYRRSLSAAGVVAEVDPLAGARETVVAGLLDFAIDRGRARGCVRLVVGVPVPPAAPVAACRPPWASAEVRVYPIAESA